MHRIILTLCLMGTLALESWGAEAVEPWVVHRTFEDFSAGTLGDSGSNIYVTRSGTVQMIHRWDLNNDGFLDIFLAQDHDILENVDALVYWGRDGGPQSILPELRELQPRARLLRQIREREANVTRLPSDGGGRSLLADLNQDGYPEIVFCNFIHNYSEHMIAFIYWGSERGYRAERRTELPTILAGGVAAADFNGDGFVDLAFANRGIEGGERFGFDRHLESYVYWNGPRGFSTERRSILPTVSAADCAAGDIDGDGFGDLLFVNNNSEGSSVYLYLGRAEGFSPNPIKWQQGNPLGAELADLDGDGDLDLILTHKDDRATLHLGQDGKLTPEPWLQLPTQGAVESRAGDLNQDGHQDLVFANPEGQRSYVYWGGQDGYQADKRSELPTLAATDAALGDFNADGRVDVAFSNEHDDKTYDVNSYIYWNGPEGFNPAHRHELQGFGAVSMAAGDLDHDRRVDLLLVNRNSGTFGPVNSLVYWGNPLHRYSDASVLIVPGTGGLTAVADLDQDGWVELIFPKGWIYQGGPDGFDPERRKDIDTKASSVAVADLNRDGYLDLVLASGNAYGSGPRSQGTIRWGGSNGLSPERQTQFALSARLPSAGTIADLNRDGHLDLIFTDVDSENLDLFWGNSEAEYGKKQRQHLKIHSASTVEIADLNADGWLDLVMGAVYDPQRFGRPMRRTTLLWGGSKGFSLESALTLEAYESEEQSVADLNRDGYLDIVMTNYHGYTTRSIPVFVYWGGPNGSYSESQRTELHGESTLAQTVADFNQDGWMDLVIVNHVERGDHGAGTNIFWGGPEGYDYSRRDWIQSFGPHFSVRRDIGNIYHRRPEEEYFSARLELPSGRTTSHLSWKASTPHGTAVKFQLRSAQAAEGLEETSWSGPQGSESYYQSSGENLQVPRKHRWLQYRALLSTPDGGSTPVLEEVRIDVKR